MTARLLFCLLATTLALEVSICLAQTTDSGGEQALTVTPADTKPRPARSLFDGITLTGWEPTEFGGEGFVEIVDGTIELGRGDPMTAINVTDDVTLPTNNYEISLLAMKTSGSDFFCGLTFPVAESWCTLVIGGWSGTVVGLSSIDGRDASQNETRSVRKFEKDRWYAIRVAVTDDSIRAWIDDEQVVDQPIAGKTFSLRNEMIPCRPLGLATYITSASYKDIVIREIEN